MKFFTLVLFLMVFSQNAHSTTVLCLGDYNGRLEVKMTADKDLSINNVSVFWKGKETLSLKDRAFECTQNFYKVICTFEVDVLRNIVDGELPSQLKIRNDLLDGRADSAKGSISLYDVMFDSSLALSCHSRK